MCIKIFGRKPKPEKQEPLVVENDLGPFTMGYLDKYNTRPVYAYSGSAVWNGSDIDVEVSCDDKETLAADKGFERLRALLADAARIENRMKAFVLREHVDKDDGKVHIWGSCSDFTDGEQIISCGEFVRRLSVFSICVLEDGCVSFMLDLDEMYTDHCMEVFMEADGSFSSCSLVG